MSEYADGFEDGKGEKFDELMVEIATLREQLAEKEDTGTPHYVNCFGSGPKHYVCALMEITDLRERLQTETQLLLDGNKIASKCHKEEVAALRLDAERYGRAKRYLQYGNGTLDARGTDSAAFDALIDALPKEEGK